MSDPGLSHRLRQRSRRAGLMIGLSMVLTIAVCAMGFTVIYSALDGFTSDFISRSNDTPTTIPMDAEEPEGAPSGQEPDGGDTAANTNADNPDTNEQSAPEPDAAPTQAPTAETASSDDEAEGDDDGQGFNPDYQLRGVTVNLRAGPSTSTGIVTALPPSTPLEYLGEDEPTDSPEDGDRWMRFATEEGLDGWIREIDVNEYQP
jgi:hypothetical protein